jgi:hypothetical protein
VKALAALAFAALLSACGTTGVVAEAPGAPPPTLPGTPAGGCDVAVSFGSYAMGIDGDALAKLEAYIAGHPGLVAKAETTPWGREGERTVCLTSTNPATTRRVFMDVQSMMPRIGKRAPITVVSRDGDQFQTRGPE